MSKAKTKIEYYAEYDEETGDYCVFDTETGKSYSSWSTMYQAERDAEERNERLKATN